MRRRLVGIICCWTLCAAYSAAAQSAGLQAKLEMLASKGDAEAQYNLGMLYNNGIGTTEDRHKAFKWFKAGAARGNALAAYKLGCYYAGQAPGVVKPNPQLALRYKLVAAKAGYSMAQWDVGTYSAAAGNHADALRWWERAALQGDPNALSLLVHAYSTGDQLRQNHETAYRWLKIGEKATGSVGDVSLEATRVRLAAPLTMSQRQRVEKLVVTWWSTATPWTIKARQGLSAAEYLVSRRKPNA